MASDLKRIEIPISDEWKRQAREIREAREWIQRHILLQHINSCPLCRPVVGKGASDGE